MKTPYLYQLDIDGEKIGKEESKSKEESLPPEREDENSTISELPDVE